MKKRVIIYSILTSILVLLGFFAYYGYWAYQTAEHVNIIKNDLESAKNNFTAQNFTQTKIDLATTQKEITLFKEDFNKFKLIQGLPLIHNNYQATKQLLLASDSIFPAANQLVTLAESLWRALPSGVTYEQLTNKQRERLLTTIYQEAPNFQGLKASLQLASQQLQNLHRAALIAPLDQITKLTDQYLPLVDQSLTVASPAVEALPFLSGLGQERTYLVIMQNNDELRPSGGFIGVYGILKIKNGAITSFQTSDSYALDKPSEKYLNLEPPAPIKEYLNPKWFFRDGNWSPDFPTTAEKLIWFYKQEKGPETIDGVIAFDPDLVSSLLKISGSLSVYNLAFNPENFTDVLQYEVEQQYLERGLKKQQRKDIVSELGTQLIQNIAKLPADRWLQLASEINRNLQERHLLFYDHNKILENIYSENNWAGSLKQTTGDYLLVVDSNMAASKTDRVMDKKINYELTANEQGELLAKVTLDYANQGEYDYRTTRLRTYTRIYVPLGSELIKITGARTNDRGDNPGQEGKADISQELGKTVFGAFWYINPGQSRTLTFEYRLPATLTEKFVTEKLYTIFVQKQAGTTGHQLTLKVKLDDSERTLETDLTVDREITVK